MKEVLRSSLRRESTRTANGNIVECDKKSKNSKVLQYKLRRTIIDGIRWTWETVERSNCKGFLHVCRERWHKTSNSDYTIYKAEQKDPRRLKTFWETDIWCEASYLYPFKLSGSFRLMRLDNLSLEFYIPLTWSTFGKPEFKARSSWHDYATRSNKEK